MMIRNPPLADSRAGMTDLLGWEKWNEGAVWESAFGGWSGRMPNLLGYKTGKTEQNRPVFVTFRHLFVTPSNPYWIRRTANCVTK